MNEFCTWKFSQHFYDNVDLIYKRVDKLEVDDKVLCLNSQHLYDNVNLSQRRKVTPEIIIIHLGILWFNNMLIKFGVFLVMNIIYYLLIH